MSCKKLHLLRLQCDECLKTLDVYSTRKDTISDLPDDWEQLWVDFHYCPDCAEKRKK